MISWKLCNQRGWVSLPIIVLLLALSTLSMNYQQRWQTAFQWRAQLDEVEKEQKFWVAFFNDLVISPTFSSATTSHCVGFCDLLSHQPQSEWRKNAYSINYRWEYYQSVADETTETSRFYRLCATQNQHQYRCWWWQEHRLLASGWATASD